MIVGRREVKRIIYIGTIYVSIYFFIGMNGILLKCTVEMFKSGVRGLIFFVRKKNIFFCSSLYECARIHNTM